MTTNQQRQLNLILKERERQDNKLGGYRLKYRVEFEILPILVQEVGEVARVLGENHTHDQLREELVRVAAVTLAWLEALGE